MKKVAFSLIASSLLFTGFSGSTLAQTKDSNNSNVTLDIANSEKLNFSNPSKLLPNQLQTSPNDILTFNSVEQKNEYLRLQNSKSTVNYASKVIDGVPSPLVSSKKYTNVFSGYLTPNWAKTDGYTLENGRTFALTVSTDGIEFGYTYSVNASFKVEANKAKNSKLAAYSDFTLNKYKVVHPKVGTYYHTEKNVTATYIKPRYQ